MTRRSRRWCFTHNNPEDVQLPRNWEHVRYVYWQHESGTSGTPHLQGFVVWTQAKKLSQVKIQDPRAHWEVTEGNLKQNEEYCSKEEGRLAGPWYHGLRPRPGRRSDLWDIKAMIDSGESIKEVSRAYFPEYVKFHRGFEKYKLLNTEKRNDRPQIFIFWGPSGVGKTRLVHETYPQAFHKPKNKWWDSYDQEHVVFLDEFYSWLPFDTLLKLLDWYPLICETKGGSVQYSAYVHVFTSNEDPRKWYLKMKWSRRHALFRRIIEFGTVMRWDAVERTFVRDNLLPYFNSAPEPPVDNHPVRFNPY